MLPHVQVDDQESCVYVSEANELVSMNNIVFNYH